MLQHYQPNGRLGWAAADGGNVTAWTPAQQSKVTAWLHLSEATLASGRYSSIPDKLNSNPAVQTVAGRRPTFALSANSLWTAAFAAADPDVLSWPLNSANNQTDKTGIALWYKPTTLSGTNALFTINSGTLGASGQKLIWQINGAGLRGTVFASGANGRFGQVTTVLTVGVWTWIRFAYDSSLGGDPNLRIYANATQQTLGYFNQGSGAAMTTLPSVTGNALLANANDSGVASGALSGAYGPNFYCLNADLTAAEELQLMQFEAPT